MTDQSEKFKRRSFADKLRAGWTKAQLMEYYGIDDAKYERVLASMEKTRLSPPARS